MAKKLILNYTFNKTAKTVTLTDYTTINLEGVLLVTNVTDNIIIYNFADSTISGSVNNNVITLLYNTSSMSDSDKLQIFYDDATNQSTELKQDSQITFATALNDLVEVTNSTLNSNEQSIVLLRRMVKLLESSGTVDYVNRQRVVIDSLPGAAVTTTIPVSGTVAVSSVIADGGIDPRYQIMDTARTAYNILRSNLTFS